MGRKRIKHLGKRKKLKNKLKVKFKKCIAIIGVLVSIIVMYNISNYIENRENAKKIVLEDFKVEFINQIEKGAKESYRKYGMLPSITIAQAILESGWGQSELSKDANNLFGIKADRNWDGKYVEVMTSENYNDKVNAKFRKYDDINDSITDHGKFLQQNNRYEEHGVFEARNYKEQAKSLQDAGYSTKKNEKGKPIYAEMLIDIIETNALYLFDNKW